MPYLILVMINAFHELYNSNGEGEESKQSPYIMDRRKDGFRVRLLLMENFTMHRISMAQYDYSYVTFKEVEQQIL